jgi:hypothetical protein
MDIEADPGALLLVFMRQLENLDDGELRETVREWVTNAEERRSYEQLTSHVTHDTLLLLSARALTHEAMQVRRRGEIPR